MAEEKIVLLDGVDITKETVQEILGLPENVVISDDLLKNKGLTRRFMLKYLYLFAELVSRRNPAIGHWAMAYKAKKLGSRLDVLPYGDVYPEVLPILYMAWAFGLVKIEPSLYETSMVPIDITLKGALVFIKVARDVKKGRPVNYKVGYLKTYDRVRSDWNKMMGSIMDSVMDDVAEREALDSMRMLYEDRGGYD